MLARSILFVSVCVAMAMAFAPARSVASRTKISPVSMSVFDSAVEDWSKTYPVPYSLGWGPTTKAERWNGRHAMFGWVALLLTGYAKGHGLIPNPDTLFVFLSTIPCGRYTASFSFTATGPAPGPPPP